MKKEEVPIKPLVPTINNGCVNKPGCNSQVVYILPYMKAA